MFASTVARPWLEFLLHGDGGPQQPLVPKLQGHQHGLLHHVSEQRDVVDEHGRCPAGDQTLVECSSRHQTAKSLTHQGDLVVDLQSGRLQRNYC